MKLITKKEMAAYPSGTVFADYYSDRGIELGSVEVKNSYNFGATSVLPDEYGKLFSWDWSLDEYSDDDKFYIFDEDDIKAMILMLSRGLDKDTHRDLSYILYIMPN